VFDGDNVRDVTATGRTRASDVIEDFMIAANTSTAKFLEARGFSSLRRIVRMPERWLRIVSLAAETGTQLPPAPDGGALEQWLLAQRSSRSRSLCRSLAERRQAARPGRVRR
jgi:exoribonuclease-2